MPSIYAPFIIEGKIAIASHKFDPVTEVCVRVDNDTKRQCGRHLCDVLSESRDAKPGAFGISCYGTLTDSEALQIERILKVRDAAMVRALDGG